MNPVMRYPLYFLVSVLVNLLCFGGVANAAEEEDISSVIKRTQAEKPKFSKRQQDLLSSRYDLSNKPVKGVTMSRGKALQDGVRVKLPEGTSWEKLAALTPDDIKNKGLWPAGFFPLPHPHHEAVESQLGDLQPGERVGTERQQAVVELLEVGIGLGVTIKDLVRGLVAGFEDRLREGTQLGAGGDQPSQSGRIDRVIF